MPNPPSAAKEINDYLGHYILVADGKAVATAAGGLALLGVLASLAESPSDQWTSLLATFLSALSVVLSCAVLFPRTPHGSAGHIFWSDINRFQSAEEYWNSLSALEPGDLGREYARQNLLVSSVLIKKNCLLKFAIASVALSVISLGGGLIFY